MNRPMPTLEALNNFAKKTPNMEMVRDTMRRFRVAYRKSINQEDLITEDHVRYQTAIFLDGEVVCVADYQCNPDACGFPTGSDILQSVVTDAEAYANSIDLADFLFEYGYNNGNVEDLRKGIEAYEECRRSHKCFEKRGVSTREIQDFISFCEDNDIDIDIATDAELD